MEILSTIRLAERLEERKLDKALAQVSYAITFQQATKSQRKTFPWYLKQLGLDTDWDERFLGPFLAEDDLEDEGAGGNAARGRKNEPTDAEIEEFLESGGTEWGRIRLEHLRDYKARKAALGRDGD